MAISDPYLTETVSRYMLLESHLFSNEDFSTCFLSICKISYSKNNFSQNLLLMTESIARDLAIKIDTFSTAAMAQCIKAFYLRNVFLERDMLPSLEVLGNCVPKLCGEIQIDKHFINNMWLLYKINTQVSSNEVKSGIRRLSYDGFKGTQHMIEGENTPNMSTMTESMTCEKSCELETMTMTSDRSVELLSIANTYEQQMNLPSVNKTRDSMAPTMSNISRINKSAILEALVSHLRKRAPPIFLKSKKKERKLTNGLSDSISSSASLKESQEKDAKYEINNSIIQSVKDLSLHTPTLITPNDSIMQSVKDLSFHTPTLVTPNELTLAVELISYYWMRMTSSRREEMKLLLSSYLKSTIPNFTIENTMSIIKSVKNVAKHSKVCILDSDSLELIRATMMQIVDQISDEQLGEACKCFGRIGFGDDMIYSAHVDEFCKRLDGEMQPSDMVACLWGITQSNLKTVSLNTHLGLFTRVSRFIGCFVDNFTPHDIALSLCCVGKQDRCLSTNTFKQVMRVLNSDISIYPIKEFTIILHTLSCMQDGRLDIDLLDKMINQCELVIQHADNLQLYLIAKSLSRIGFKKQTLIIGLFRAIYPNLPQFKHSHLASLFFFFSMSGVKDDSLTRRFTYELDSRINRLSAQDVSNVLLAISQLKVEVTDLFKKSIIDRTSELLEETDSFTKSPHLLVNVLLTCTSVKPPVETVTSYLEFLLSRLCDLQPIEHMRIMIACAHLKITDTRIMNKFYEVLRKSSEKMRGDELLSIVWAMDELQYSTPKIRRKIGSLLVIKTYSRLINIRDLVDAAVSLDNMGIYHRLNPKLQHDIYSKTSVNRRKLLRPPKELPVKLLADDTIKFQKTIKASYDNPGGYIETDETVQILEANNPERVQENRQVSRDAAIWTFMEMVKHM
eukprot:GHVL01023595.1.p1 GENE.GHVL01023595.1~~GHVL01023595.1.p1  ORF type:complete len:1014 (-),score=165.84 GHVL01023595.1:850-3561(-)